jgi:hypothetical protein
MLLRLTKSLWIIRVIDLGLCHPAVVNTRMSTLLRTRLLLRALQATMAMLAVKPSLLELSLI